MSLCCVCCSRLHKVHEEDGKPFELEMSWVCEESGRKHARVPAELLAEAEAAAKAAADDSDMED
jgi:20S proteasome subunit alpha 7